MLLRRHLLLLWILWLGLVVFLFSLRRILVLLPTFLIRARRLRRRGWLIPRLVGLGRLLISWLVLRWWLICLRRSHEAGIVYTCRDRSIECSQYYGNAYRKKYPGPETDEKTESKPH